MFTPIHMMLMTNHLVQQNQMMMLRHRQQQARNAAIRRDNEREVSKMKKCPVCDMACPYINRSGNCVLDNPAEECDEFAYYDDDPNCDDDADETGFDPYLGCYTDDC